MSKRHNDAKALITRVVFVQEIIAYTSSGFQKPYIDCANPDIGPRIFIIALRIIFFYGYPSLGVERSVGSVGSVESVYSLGCQRAINSQSCVQRGIR